MKKKIIIFLSLLVMFMTGCGNNSMTPTAKVEEFLGRYQSMDSEVLTQLDNVISNDTSMNDTQKKDYKTLMEKQYQNLSYKIKDEEGEIIGGAVDTISSFITYKIKQLMDVTDKAKYEITFHLTKEDGEWVIEDLTDVDRQKIHGLFED